MQTHARKYFSFRTGDMWPVEIALRTYYGSDSPDFDKTLERFLLRIRSEHDQSEASLQLASDVALLCKDEIRTEQITGFYCFKCGLDKNRKICIGGRNGGVWQVNVVAGDTKALQEVLSVFASRQARFSVTIGEEQECTVDKALEQLEVIPS